MDQYRLRCTLLGHSNDVRAVAYFPSGGGIVTASRDCTVRLWLPVEERPEFQLEMTYHGHSHYVNAVCVLPPKDGFPRGLIASGGQDNVIKVYDPSLPGPLYMLNGHTNNVSALAAHTDGSLLSGSWDMTARVWEGETVRHVLKGHTAAVWGVAFLGDVESHVFTVSADKTVRMWLNGASIRTFQGHQDVIRGIAILSEYQFLTCSNDNTIKEWSVPTGECLNTYVAHENFVYSVCVSPRRGQFITCSEDRTARVWNQGSCVQIIRLPAQTAWCLALLSNGDFVVGSSDATARVFTSFPDLQASPEEIKAFEEQVAGASLTSSDIGNMKLTDLPGKEALLEHGTRDGQTRLVRDGALVSAYQWDTASEQWKKIGDVVGQPDATTSIGKITYEGKEYDYVFDVDLEGHKTLKLPYNVTEDPWHAAQAFIHRNDLPQLYLDQVANFILQNTKGMNISTGSGGGEYADPFTGGNRYVPGGTSENNVQSKAPAQPVVPQSKAADFPVKMLLKFDTTKMDLLREALNNFNNGLGPSNPMSIRGDLLNDLIDLTQSNRPLKPDQLEALEKILHWPKESLLPALDLLRLALLFPSVNDTLCGGENLSHGIRLLTYFEDHLANEASPPNNCLLIIRALCNLMQQPTGRKLADVRRQQVLKMAEPHAKNSNKQLQIALATLVLNYSILLMENRNNFDGYTELVPVAVQLLQNMTAGEALYRVLVALGNCTYDNDLRTLVSLCARDAVVHVGTKSDEQKVQRCAKDLLALLPQE